MVDERTACRLVPGSTRFTDQSHTAAKGAGTDGVVLWGGAHPRGHVQSSQTMSERPCDLRPSPAKVRKATRTEVSSV